MSKKLLTIEYSNKSEVIELHLNREGANELRMILDKLIKNNESEHCHLMTEDWGGIELTSNKQNLSSDYKLINHLKLLYWKDEG